ncbi:uncharacterized protein [Panulirus ornatus]
MVKIWGNKSLAAVNLTKGTLMSDTGEKCGNRQDETKHNTEQKKEKVEKELETVCAAQSASLATVVFKQVDEHSGNVMKDSTSDQRDVSHWLIFLCASIMGLHLVHQRKDGTCVVCKVRIVPAVVLYLMSCTVALGNLTYLFSKGYINHILIIMIMPVIFGCIFMVMICVVEIVNAQKMVDYMEDLRRAGLMVRHNKAQYYLLCLILFASVDTYATLVLLPIPADRILDLLVPVILDSIVPSLLDHYMCGFIDTLQTSFQKLARRVGEIKCWTLAEVQAVASSWLTLSRLVTKHNQVFSYVLHIRLTLFVAQMMSLLYGLIQLRGPGCLGMGVALLAPLIHVLLRSYVVSVFGDNLQLAHENVLSGLREALRTHLRPQHGNCGHNLAIGHQCGKSDTCVQGVKRGQTECGQDERCDQNGCGQDECSQALHNLTSRLEARPPSITIWGLNRLGRSTWVHQASAVLTYLVILLQLRPQDRSQLMTCSDLDTGTMYNVTAAHSS